MKKSSLKICGFYLSSTCYIGAINTYFVLLSRKDILIIFILAVMCLQRYRSGYKIICIFEVFIVISDFTKIC